MPRISQYLAVVGRGSDAVVRCRCGHTIGPASENCKLHVPRREGPVQNAGPWVDPQHIGGDAFVCREFFCPECLTLLDVEIAQRGEPIVWDVRLSLA